MGFLFQRSDASSLSKWWWTTDHVLITLMVLLSLSGVLLVATASPAVAMRLDLSPWHFVWRHLFYTVLALGAALSVSMLAGKWVWRLGSLIAVGALMGVLMTLVLGVEVKGSTRWLWLGPFSVQPSEFLKPGLVVLWAWLLAKGHEHARFPGFILAIGLYAFAVLLLMLQPDLGMAVILTAAFFSQIILAGCPLRYVGCLFALGLAGLFAAYHSFGHVKSRIDRFLDPESGDTFQVDLSLRSFIKGGLFGKGPGQGEVKMRLPDAHADFTFAVLAEEMGLISAFLILCLYLYVILRLARRLMRSDALFPILAGGGLLTIFATQILVHIGSSLQLLPAKGMTLPFLSYGGSSLLAIGLTFGMLLALTRQQSGGHYAAHHLAERMQAVQDQEKEER